MSEPAELVRAVLDTNVLLRGITSTVGPSGRLVDALMAKEFQLVTSRSILDELGDVLRRPKIQKRTPFSDTEIDATIRALRRVAKMVPGAYVVKMVRTDPTDDHVVAAALEGGAAYLVSEDRRDLLALKVSLVKGFHPVQIVTAHDFYTQILQHRR